MAPELIPVLKAAGVLALVGLPGEKPPPDAKVKTTSYEMRIAAIGGGNPLEDTVAFQKKTEKQIVEKAKAEGLKVLYFWDTIQTSSHDNTWVLTLYIAMG